MKLKEVFEKSVQFFKDKKIETPRLDAELLISHVLKIDRVQIYVKYEQPLNESEVQACRDVIKRRGLGEPVAYITNVKGFFGENFFVGAGVLIPRPETEIIVEEALKFINSQNIESPKILDLGAGTGCIGFSILKNCETASLVSIEKSAEAHSFLTKNQLNLKLENRSKIILSDVMAVELAGEKFDIIVSNPPYIAADDVHVENNVKKFEPHQALFSGENGFSALLSWSDKFKSELKYPGLMLFEMGHLQGEKLKQHFESFKQFSNVDVIKDLSGLDRIIKGTQ